MFALCVPVALASGCGDDSARDSEDSGTVAATAVSDSASTGPSSGASESSGETSAGPGTGDESNSGTSTSAGPTSASASESESESESGESSTTSPVTSGPDTTGDPSGTTGPQGCEDSGNGGGDIDYSYLWAANTGQGSISKVNTVTLIEEARYYSDPNPAAASPSRTSVSIDGRFAAVSNRGTGTVTMVAATVEDCVDKNMNGVIDTSPDKDTLMPFADEECRMWTVTVDPPIGAHNHGPRGTTFDPGIFNQGTCEYDAQKLWVGWHAGAGVAYMGRIDINSGVMDAKVEVPGWTSAHAPYGAAMDGDGNVWFTAVFEDNLYRINTQTLQLTQWNSGLGHTPYGMTVDFNGMPWFGGYCGPVSYFDPQTETFHVLPDTNSCHRGIAVDKNYQVWIASNANGQAGCGLVQVDGNTKTFVKNHYFDQCGTPVGVSIDLEEYVWIVDYDGWAYRMDPQTEVKDQVIIAGVHYTYSDMTGGALKNVFVPE